MNIFICYDRCTTCIKAERWLADNGIEYSKRPIKEENPTAEELKEFSEKSGRAPSKMFNTSGILYRQNGIKDRLPLMTEDEMFRLLATDGMMVKRPILVSEDTVLFGFKEEEWKKALLDTH